MKIVLVTGTYLPYISGVSTSTHNIARFLADQGHDVTVIAPKPLKADPTVDNEKGIRVVRTWALPDILYPGRTTNPIPFSMPSVYKAITKDTDIVHIQEPLSVGITALYRAKALGVTVVGALHFTPEQIARMAPFIPKQLTISVTHAYIRWVYGQYASIMVPTKTFVDFLHSVGVKTPMQVISNGVDTHEFVPVLDPSPFKKKLGLDDEKFWFFVLSRLDKDKYVDDVIQALPKTQKNIGVIIAGLGPEKDRLHGLAKHLGVEERIRWYGHVSEEEMVALYHASQGFIMMGIFEVQSIVSLQALACGLPILAAHAGALPELCHDKENGFLVESHDTNALATHMNKLASDKSLREKMGEESRRISLNHDKTKAMKTVESWYKRTLKRS